MINKKFYLSSFIVLGILFVVLSITDARLGGDDPRYLALYPLLVMYIIGMVFHYKAWKAIQDGHASTSPGKAVGFIFIPLYNVYWLFRTLNGFARDVNVYIARHQVNTKDLPEGLYFFQCVLFLAMPILFRFQLIWVTYLAVIAMVWLYINTLVIINKSANAVNAIYESKTSLNGDEE